jgi:hypothetical protein
VLIESPNGSLSNNGLIFTSNTDWIDEPLTKTLACSRGTIGWTHGVHEWEVRLEAHPPSVSVGITPVNLTLTEDEWKGYGVHSNDGTANGPKNSDLKIEKDLGVPGSGLPVGSMISVRLDIDQRTLTFGLNGKWNAPAFFSLPFIKWYPYIQIKKTGGAATMILPK